MRSFALALLLLASLAQASVPSTPSGLTSTGYVNGAIPLAWTFDAVPTSFYVYINGALKASPTRAQVAVAGSQFNYTVTGLSSAVLPASVYLVALGSTGSSGPSPVIVVNSAGGGTGDLVSIGASVPLTVTCSNCTSSSVTYTAAYQGGTWSVGVNNFPASQAVTQGGPFTVSGSVAVTQGGPFTVSGSVAVTSMPAVTQGSAWTVSGSVATTQASPWTVSGSVQVTNFLGVSVVSGVAGLSVTASQGSAWTVSGSVAITGALPAGSNGIGSVTVTSMPAVTQGSAWTVSGSVAVTGTVNTNVLSTPLGTSLPAYTSTNPLPIQMASILFTLSTLNSSSAQLGAGATFTGVTESAFNQPGMQVMVVCDQNYTVNIDQFDGANNQVDTDTFTRTAGTPLDEAVQVNGDAVRVRVTNTGGGTTTTLRIETTYGPLSPFPTANTSLGNFRTSINEVAGVDLTAFGSVPVYLSGPASVGPVTFTVVSQALTITTAGFSSVGYYTKLSFTGTVVVEQSPDAGTTWYQVPFWYGPSATLPTVVTSQANPATGSRIYVSTGGSQLTRLRASVVTTPGGIFWGQASNANYPLTIATTVSSLPATPAGANVIGSVTAGFPIAAQALSVSSPAFTGGAVQTGFIKASAAVLMRVVVTGLTATATSPTVVHLYNQTTAPAVGATANQVARCVNVGPGTTPCEFGPQGMSFATGLAYTITAGMADADGSTPTAESAVSFQYK